MSKPRLASREQLREVLVLPRRVLVLITRDMAESIAKIVFEHEVDILAEVFGEGSVQVVQDPLEHGILIAPVEAVEKAREEQRKAIKARKPITPIPYSEYETPARWEPLDYDNPEGPGHWVDAPVSVGEEMARLRTMYGRHNEQPAFNVDVAYPHERDFIDACGGPWKAAKDAA
jgi:hypothetical protein